MDINVSDREFRLYQGKPDVLYQNMMMCRDKSWLAVYKNRLSRKEMLCACLHDLLPGLLEDAQGRYLSMELSDWASHDLYEYRFFEGSFEEKMAFMQRLLAEGEPVFVGTVHPLLPFSARYNPNLDQEAYQKPNHIFVILGEEAGRYVYFDTSSYKSAAFEPYPGNPELGWIQKETVDAVLQKLFQLGYVVWHEENRAHLETYAQRLLADFVQAYEQKSPEKSYLVSEGDGQPGMEGFWFRGRKAIADLQRHLMREDLDLSAASWEFDFIDQGDLLNWKVTDLATRRKLMAMWLAEANRTEEAQLWTEAAGLWNRLSTFLLYRREKGKYGSHPRYGRILEEILAQEDKIYAFLKNFA